MRSRTLIVLCVLLVGAGPVTQPASQPATQPSEILARLNEQIRLQSVHVRELMQSLEDLRSEILRDLLEKNSTYKAAIAKRDKLAEQLDIARRTGSSKDRLEVGSAWTKAKAVVEEMEKAACANDSSFSSQTEAIANEKKQIQEISSQIALEDIRADQIASENEKKQNGPEVPMYDAMKSNSGRDGGIPLHGSSLRPLNPGQAYAVVKNGMTVDQVIKVLGGYQSERESDDVRTIEWFFVTEIGGELTMSVQFKSGVVTSKSKSQRG